MEEERRGMKNRAKLRWTKWRLKINKTHRLFEGVRDFFFEDGENITGAH